MKSIDSNDTDMKPDVNQLEDMTNTPTQVILLNQNIEYLIVYIGIMMLSKTTLQIPIIIIE